jgi:hypothetical protein
MLDIVQKSGGCKFFNLPKLEKKNVAKDFGPQSLPLQVKTVRVIKEPKFFKLQILTLWILREAELYVYFKQIILT